MSGQFLLRRKVMHRQSFFRCLEGRRFRSLPTRPISNVQACFTSTNTGLLEKRSFCIKVRNHITFRPRIVIFSEYGYLKSIGSAICSITSNKVTFLSCYNNKKSDSFNEEQPKQARNSSAVEQQRGRNLRRILSVSIPPSQRGRSYSGASRSTKRTTCIDWQDSPSDPPS